jgi:hypothetical protein
MLVIILKNSTSYFKGAYETSKLGVIGEIVKYQLQENVVQVPIKDKYRQAT